jgi:choice-of-anchor B domain-containing protein
MAPLLRLAVVLLVLVPAAVSAQVNAGSKNMTLIGHLNPSDTSDLHSSVWGYAAPDGREYAFFASQIGTHIVDVTTTPIRQVAFVAGPRNPWREFKTYRNYLYVSTEEPDIGNGAGIQIIDLSELPARVRLLRVEQAVSSVHTIFVRDHYLYAMGTGPDAQANGGAVIFDLEPDPINPRIVGRVSEHYYHDAWVRNDTLFGAAIWGGGIDIVDIRDKAQPRMLANINYPGSGTHNVEATDDGRYLVSSDEIGETRKTMKVWDLRHPDGPRLVTEYTPSLEDIVHNVHVIGRYVYAAWYTAGVRIIDMIDPAHPREVAYFDTYEGRGPSFNGVWEVYGWLPSGRILASDRNSGLYVFQFNGALGGSISGVVTDVSTGRPIAGATIIAPELGRTITTDSQGRYYLGGAVGDVVTVDASRFGYHASSMRIEITGDLIRNISLAPAALRAVEVTAQDTSGTAIERFSFAVEPYIPAQSTTSGRGSVLVPGDSTYNVTVGAWGYRIAQVPVNVGASTTVTATLRPRYQDNATLDLGWSYASPSDDAESGRWGRALLAPETTPSSRFYPHGHADGGPGYAFVTGGGGPAPLAMDVEGGTTTLMSPAMDLSAYPNPIISYSQWYMHGRSFSDSSALDSISFEISNDDGRTWVRALTEAMPRLEWSRKVVFPARFLPMTSTVRVRFVASDLSAPSTVALAIDNFDVARSLSDLSSVLTPGDASSPSMTVRGSRDAGEAIVTVDRSVTSARVELFDGLGRLVGTLHDGALEAGEHRLALPQDIASGAYRIRVATGRASVVAQIVVVR